jgi:large subunit ribosomal protein L24
MKIKKGDNVIILKGKDRGGVGQVLRAIPTDAKVVVEGQNIAKRHQKAKKAGEAPQIREIEMPIAVANVALVGADGKAVKVGYKIQADGTKVRINKKTGAAL